MSRVNEVAKKRIEERVRYLAVEGDLKLMPGLQTNKLFL